MIKLENNMLILDATISKQDATAINDFICIAKYEERKEVISLLKGELKAIKDLEKDLGYVNGFEHALLLIRGEQK